MTPHYANIIALQERLEIRLQIIASDNSGVKFACSDLGKEQWNPILENTPELFKRLKNVKASNIQMIHLIHGTCFVYL